MEKFYTFQDYEMLACKWMIQQEGRSNYAAIANWVSSKLREYKDANVNDVPEDTFIKILGLGLTLKN